MQTQTIQNQLQPSPWALAAGTWPPWIFIHDTDKVEGDLMVLFFCLDFSIPPLNCWKFFCRRPQPLVATYIKINFIK